MEETGAHPTEPALKAAGRALNVIRDANGPVVV
jgi:hypothetical protein